MPDQHLLDIIKSSKLNHVCYDIRGPILDRALKLEAEGQQILKLNIGNPAAFGFDAPDELVADIIANLRNAQGYTDSRGLFAARKAIMQESQQLGISGVSVDDIYLGNGVSELIMMATQALLNKGDEVLIPSPDYPLWTAAVSLAGGNPIHYDCDEESDWQPSFEDIRQKITSRTKALVVINPNNPTGAVYSQRILELLVELATEHQLVLFADEIYSKIVYDDHVFIPLARLAEDCLCISFNGLSKSYRAAGFRCGWIMVSGRKAKARDYLLGLNMLASMRLCANVPAMFAVQTALGGHQSINNYLLPGGRLYEQREAAWSAVSAIPGVTCVKPKGALYLFPKIDRQLYEFESDETLILNFLEEHNVLLAQGTAFNFKQPNHFRIVFLPDAQTLQRATEELHSFLKKRVKV